MRRDYGVFEHLAAFNPEERATKNAARALIAARSRAERRFSGFIQKAASAEEREDRLRLVSQDLLGVVHTACTEHDFDAQDEIQQTLTAVLAHLRKNACEECGCSDEDCECEGKKEAAAELSDDDICPDCGRDKTKDGHDPCPVKAGLEEPASEDAARKSKEAAAPLPVEGEQEKPCEWCGGKGTDGGEQCGPCKGKGKRVPPKEGATKEALENSSLQGKRESVDTDTSLDVNLDNGRPDFIDSTSKRHPAEKQDVTEGGTDEDYDADPLAASTNSTMSEQVSVDTPMGSEETGPKTKTFPNEGQANAVTSHLRIV